MKLGVKSQIKYQYMSERILIIYLSGRPHQIANALNNLFATAEADVCVYLCYSGEKIHIEERSCLKVEYLGLTDPENMKVTKFLNNMSMRCIDIFNGTDDDLVGGWCDDLVGEKGWGESILSAYRHNKDKDYLVVNDTCFPVDYAYELWYHSPIPFRSIRYIKDVGHNSMWSEHYARTFGDSDSSQIAKLLNRFQFVEKAIIRHEHYLQGRREMDDLDKKNSLNDTIDAQIYQARRQVLMDTLVPDFFKTNCSRWKENRMPKAVLNAIDRVGVTGVIETGTFTGCGSTRFFRKLTSLPIHTIEISPYCITDALQSLSGFSGIHIAWGFSIDFGQCHDFLEYDIILNGNDFSGFNMNQFHCENINIDGLPDPKAYYKAEICRYNRLMSMPFYFGTSQDNLLEKTFDNINKPLFFLDSSPATALLEYHVINRKYDDSFCILLTETNHFKNFRTKKIIETDDRMAIVDKNDEEGWLVAYRK
jgi:hypothetical protein